MPPPRGLILTIIRFKTDKTRNKDIIWSLKNLELDGDFSFGGYDLTDVGAIQFDTSFTHTTHSEGSVHWNDDDKTLNIDTEVADTSIQVGQEVVVRCTNKTGSTITNGSVVYISGAQGQRPTITLADADTEATAITTIGIATHDIDNNQTGYVTVFGLVRDIDTSSFTEGDCLFLSQTAGGLRNTAPPSPAYRIQVAKCVYSHATEGAVLVDVDAASHPSIPVATSEPSGFENRTDSDISFNNASRTFTIEPAVDEFNTWHGGTKIIHDSALTSQIADQEGMWFFYIDTNGDLQNTDTFTNDLITNGNAIVAMVYWDATNKEIVGLGDERHGIAMDGVTHSYLHNTFGARWSSGGSFGDITADGAGSSNTHATISVADVITYDEDIKHDSTDTWITQVLTSPAQIPVIYLDGAAGNWRALGTNDYPVADATKVGSGTLLHYNEWTGATWQLTQVTSGKFVLTHIFATNSSTTPVIAIVGQNEYASKNAAYTGSTDELATLYTTGLPMVEFVPLGTIIYQTSSSYTNAPKARIITTEDGGNYIDWRVATPTRSLGLGVVDDGRFFLLAGRTGGQTAYGSTVASENLTLSSTANATKGKIILGTSTAYDEVNDRLGIGTTGPSSLLTVYGGDDEDTHDDELIAYFGSKIDSGEWTGIGLGAYTQSVSKSAIIHERADSFGRGKLHLCTDNTADASSCTNADARVTITAAGLVGIGTTSPTGKLSVNYDIGQGSYANIWTDNNGQWMHWFNNLGAGGYSGIVSAGDHALIWSNGSQNTGNLVLAGWNSVSGGVKITHDGKVGIGTTSPSEALDVNSDAIRIRTAQTPASAGATGTAGMICWDSSYVYVCVATNTWKRAAISTW